MGTTGRMNFFEEGQRQIPNPLFFGKEHELARSTENSERKKESDSEERSKDLKTVGKLPLDYWERPVDIQGGLVGGMGEKDLLMYSVHRIEVGVEVGMTVYYPGECYLGCIEGKGRIVWRDYLRGGDWKGYKYGLRITEMALNDQERLREALVLEQARSREQDHEAMFGDP